VSLLGDQSRGDSTREKEFKSWLCVYRVCVLYFQRGSRLEILSYPFIPKICSGLILISRLDTKMRSNANCRLEF
jgi:hypothetical protein